MLPRAPLLAAALALAAGHALAAPAEPRFERVETATGPSHNSIFAITQDRQGFLWIGTQDGLDRFDGERFVVWRHDPRDPGSLSANRVNSVLEDRRRRLWVGTAAGIDRLDRREGRFVRCPLPAREESPPAVLELVEDRDGRLWAATTEGLLGWDEASSRWISALPGVAPSSVRRVRPDPRGGAWLLAEGELLRWVEGRIELRIEVRGELNGLDVDARGRPWLDPAELRDADGALQSKRTAPGDAPTQAVLAEPSGEVWSGIHRGLRHRSADGSEVRDLPVDPSRPLANFVVALFRDAGGTLWLGTENGLYRHDPWAKRFQHVGVVAGGGETPHVSALVEDSIGEVWVGSYGAGLFRLGRGADGVRILEPAGWRLPDPTIWSLAAFGDRLLAGGEGWLCELEPRGWKASCDERLDALQRVGALAPGPGGELWLAELGALRHRRSEAWRRFELPDEPGAFGSREPTFLLPDGDRIWVATFGGALKRFDLGPARFERVVRRAEDGAEQTSPVFDLHRDAAGRIWLGTGDGLSRFDPASGSFRNYGPGDGLPGSNVYSLLEDAQGRLWLGTNRGLVRFDPGSGEGVEGAFRTYGREEGVLNVEFNRHARLRTRDGRFLFGGMSGITEFRPSEIRVDPVAPRVALTRIEILAREGRRILQPFGLDRLELGPDDSAFSIEFAALDFSSARGRRFAYRLEGLDPQWVATETGRVARYAGLAPGSYVFRVRAANGDGVWSASPASLAILVRPPFWATWWFRGLILCALAFVLAVLYRWRVRHLIELERMRLRIAGDLHDELGSDLSGIALATSRLGARGRLEPADRERLAEVQEASLRVMRGLRDIVWYVNPDHDTLESTARRMRSVAADLLPECDVRFSQDLDAESHGIDMSTRRHLFLVFKELVHNVARHAEARSVEVGLAVRDGELHLAVEDDGRGFDPAAASDGSGLASLRRRAAQIGGRLEIDSRPGGGTRAHLVAPMTRTRQRAKGAGAPRLGRGRGRQ